MIISEHRVICPNCGRVLARGILIGTMRCPRCRCIVLGQLNYSAHNEVGLKGADYVREGNQEVQGREEVGAVI